LLSLLGQVAMSRFLGPENAERCMLSPAALVVLR